jgi:hypothetical protein
MLLPVQHMDILAYFDISVIFDAIVARAYGLRRPL